jgi:hypothetical protein
MEVSENEESKEEGRLKKNDLYEGKMVSLVEVYSSLSQKQRKPIHEDTEY